MEETHRLVSTMTARMAHNFTEPVLKPFIYLEKTPGFPCIKQPLVHHQDLCLVLSRPHMNWGVGRRATQAQREFHTLLPCLQLRAECVTSCKSIKSQFHGWWLLCQLLELPFSLYGGWGELSSEIKAFGILQTSFGSLQRIMPKSFTFLSQQMSTC